MACGPTVSHYGMLGAALHPASSSGSEKQNWVTSCHSHLHYLHRVLGEA